MPRKKLSNRLLTILAVSTAALTLLVGALIANPPEPTGTIYANMYIHGIPVGGMTPEEAEAALMEMYQPFLSELTIQFSHEGETIVELTYKELGITLDFSALIQAAQEYSNRRNLPARVARLAGRAHHISDLPALRQDNARLRAQVQTIANKLQASPVNAGFAYANGQITITPEASGTSVDIEGAEAQLRELLSAFDGGIVTISTTTIPPRFTAADMQFEVSSLGTFATPLATDEDEPRVRNIRRASDRVHNQMLYPGEVFSSSTLIGAHLPGSGYEAAIVLVRGEPVEDIGGGICQVVTTLYNAVLLSELTIVQRHNHSARVSYADFGFDATIAGDYYDFKFKNNTLRPILITSQLERGALHVVIHGLEERPQNRSIQFSSRRVDIVSPEPYKEVVDANLGPGERVVTLESQLGYKYEVYKHIFVDGIEVEQVRVNTSSYRPLQGIMHVGAE